MRKTLLVVNPKAGKMQSKTGMFDIISPLCAKGFDPTVHITQARLDATKYVASNGSDYDMIVCCGGDGTLNEIISGVMLLDEKKPIGYIPAGSTNDFATSLGLPKGIPAAVRSITNGVPTYYDIGRMNDRYFTYIACFGAFTKTSYATPQDLKNSLGHFAYVLEGIRSISEIKPYHVKITVDGMETEGDYLYCAVSNSTSVAGMIKLDKKLVDFTDGVFELMLVRSPKDLGEFNAILAALTMGKYDSEVVQFLHGSEFVFESDDKIEWTVDGEFAGSINYAKISCLHNQIQLVR